MIYASDLIGPRFQMGSWVGSFALLASANTASSRLESMPYLELLESL